MYLLRKHVRDKFLDSLSHMGLGKGKIAKTSNRQGQSISHKSWKSQKGRFFLFPFGTCGHYFGNFLSFEFKEGNAPSLG